MQAHAGSCLRPITLVVGLEHSTATLLFKIQKELTLPKTTKKPEPRKLLGKPLRQISLIYAIRNSYFLAQLI